MKQSINKQLILEAISNHIKAGAIIGAGLGASYLYNKSHKDEYNPEQAEHDPKYRDEWSEHIEQHNHPYGQ